ncbi:MAG: hypothetical protein U5K72_03785 [Balneolaceae bacterium]|nr:hypothetical protein [Balneolaceae bacterium]
MGNKSVPFEASTVYHIYNRGHGRSLIFREKKNYQFFLNKFSKYILPIADIYAYCLLPNHYHFLIQIKNEDELRRLAKNRSRYKNLTMNGNFVKFISDTFGAFFNSYAKSFNKVYNRHGSLFEESIKRKGVESDDYFTTMIRYIHFNPVFHGMTSHPAEWQYSSYHACITEKPTKLKRNSVLEWFGGKEAFLKFHHTIQQDEIEKIRHLLFDD